MADTVKKIDALSYKEATTELEHTIRDLESGELELEDSLAHYARGVELLQSLRSRLASAEQKISVLEAQLDQDSTSNEVSVCENSHVQDEGVLPDAPDALHFTNELFHGEE